MTPSDQTCLAPLGMPGPPFPASPPFYALGYGGSILLSSVLPRGKEAPQELCPLQETSVNYLQSPRKRVGLERPAQAAPQKPPLSSLGPGPLKAACQKHQPPEGPISLAGGCSLILQSRLWRGTAAPPVEGPESREEGSLWARGEEGHGRGMGESMRGPQTEARSPQA